MSDARINVPDLTATRIVRWETPRPKMQGRGPRRPRSSLESIVLTLVELAKRPGEWAVIDGDGYAFRHRGCEVTRRDGNTYVRVPVSGATGRTT